MAFGYVTAELLFHWFTLTTVLSPWRWKFQNDIVINHRLECIMSRVPENSCVKFPFLSHEYHKRNMRRKFLSPLSPWPWRIARRPFTYKQSNIFSNNYLTMPIMFYCHLWIDSLYSGTWDCTTGSYRTWYPLGLILDLRPNNESCHYKVTPSLIGWAQT